MNTPDPSVPVIEMQNPDVNLLKEIFFKDTDGRWGLKRSVTLRSGGNFMTWEPRTRFDSGAKPFGMDLVSLLEQHCTP